jgi:hypothetical protein
MVTRLSSKVVTRGSRREGFVKSQEVVGCYLPSNGGVHSYIFRQQDLGLPPKA